MNAPEKITAAEPMNAAHEILMKAASGMCSQEIAAAITGTPRPTKPQIKAAEKMLKAIHDCGMLASQPGRGGVALYSLTTPVCNINKLVDVSPTGEGETAEVCDLVQTGGDSQTSAVIGDSEGGETDAPEAVGSIPKFGHGLSCGACHDGCPGEQCKVERDSPPISNEVRAQMQSLNIVTPDEFSLLNVIADIRAAIGDPEGKIMLGDLAAHIQRDIGELIESLEVEKRVSGSAISAVAHICEHLGCDDHNGHVPVLRAIDALRAQISSLNAENIALKTLNDAMPGFGGEYQAQQITSLAADVMTTRTALTHAINEADRLRSELAIERQARQALQEKVNAAPAPAPKGYVLKTPKRAMRRFGEEAAAQSAAMAVARAGRTGEVFALVPVGRAVRGAEWKGAR